MTMRKGFGMITAILLVVAVSVLGMVMMNRTSESIKKVSDDVLRTQATLLLDSATEFTLLRISGFDRNNTDGAGSKGCLENLDINASPFDINVTVWYMFDVKPSGCMNVLTEGINNDSNGTAVIDVTVKLASDMNLTESSEGIVVHRRTVQKP